ncbi:MAG: electron transport complex subunit RsxC [Planctomycetota bacterium]|jgi:electron transport complex protein RnfC
MSASTIPGKGKFARGIHPEDRKSLSAGAAVEVLPTPKSVLIPLLQHIGAPCELAVKPRTEVQLGDLVGRAGGFVSAAVHASVDGKTGAESVTTLPNGRHVPAVPIAASDAQGLSGQALWDDVFGGDWPTAGLEPYDPARIVEAVSSGGLVGLGGAAFPTHVKLTRNEKRPVDTLVVNGCECEPYLTADHRLMLEAPKIVVIEDNKPDAAESMRAAAEGTDVEVATVRTQYPMGGERSLLVAAMGREVPTLGLPLDVGVVVINVGTAAAVARAVVRGKPLTHRIVSVTGDGIARPKNLLVPVGAGYADLIDFCGGLTDDAGRVIAGGPMMGFALAELDVPVTKGTSGVVVLTAEQVRAAEETACIRCGRCVDVCPLRLVPTKLALAARHGDWETAKRYYLPACCECGCCAYVCPAKIPLVQLMRMGKAMMPKK